MTNQEKSFTALPKIVVAYGINGEIGKNNQMPWPKMKSDLKRFSEITKGGVVIMGRNTYESIGMPLPNRENIVLSRNKNLTLAGVAIYSTLEDCLDSYTNDPRELFLIGGENLYHQYLPMARTILATEISFEDSSADAFFKIPEKGWEVVSREDYSADTNNPYDYSFVTYQSNRKIVDTSVVSNRPEYLEKLKIIEQDKICPFCEKRFIENGNIIIDETEHWSVIKNYEPYKGSKDHLIIIAKRHIEHIQEMGKKAQSEFMHLNIKHSSGIKSGGIAMRFGDIEYTGASVSHFHSHIFDNDENSEETIKFKISN